MRYLCVKFYDNDFSFYAMAAVKRVYHALVTNNCNVMEPSPGNYVFNTSPNIVVGAFEKVYAVGNLIPLIRRMILAEYIARDQCQGLDHVFTQWYPNSLGKIVRDDTKWLADVAETYRYIDVAVEFHETSEFAQKDDESSSIALDMYTGACLLF